MIDLWTEASRDVEAEHLALRMASAKVAVAGLWPFLALAQSEREFEHRLALASDHIANAVPVDLLQPVVASLREDFGAITAVKDAEGEEDADDADGDGKPDWLQKKIKGEGSLYFHAGLGRWVAYDASDYEPDRPRVRTDAPSGEDDDPEETAYWRSLGEDYERRPYYYHQARKAWMRVAEVEEKPEGGGNPWYFTGGPEAGPLTGDTHQFPPHPTGSDPIDPLNQMFPMQPSAWTVPPGGEWKEAPMQFDPPGGPSAQRAAAWKAAGEGQNPYYFAGGTEGVVGDPQASFPEDVAKGVDPEDPIDEWYGPQPVSGGPVDYGNRVAIRRVAQTPHHPAPDSDPMLGTEFDSPQERERYRRAVDGEQQDSRASTTFEAVRRTSARQFFDPGDPGVRTLAIGTNPFSSGNPFGDGAEGGPPMPGSDSQQVSSSPFGTTPATTPPRTMPSSGGPPSGPDQAPSDEAAKQQAQQGLGATGARHTAIGVSYERPDDDDPTGAGDEYVHNTWEGPINTRPRQSPEHRNVNTPQRPQAPIPTIGSPEPSEREEDSERREASRIAALAVRKLVGA